MMLGILSGPGALNGLSCLLYLPSDLIPGYLLGTTSWLWVFMAGKLLCDCCRLAWEEDFS
jgi:hypothetical protein